MTESSGAYYLVSISCTYGPNINLTSVTTYVYPIHPYEGTARCNGHYYYY